MILGWVVVLLGWWCSSCLVMNRGVAALVSSSSSSTSDVLVEPVVVVETCVETKESASTLRLSSSSSPLYPCTDSFLRDFWHDVPIQGFHIACLTQENDHRKLTLFPNAFESRSQSILSSSSSSDPDGLVLDWPNIQKILQSRLDLPAGDNNFQPFAIFSPEGRRLVDGHTFEDPNDEILFLLLKNGVFLIYQGGQFLWPGVRPGFQRHNVSLYSVMPLGLQEQHVNHTITIITLSMKPLVLSIHGFLTQQECLHIQKKARPFLEYSEVVLMDHDQGRPASDFRTSQSTFLSSEGDAILQDLEDRVASLTRIPRNHQEQVQVLRYGLGEKYDAHTDYFDPSLYQNSPETLEHIGYGRRNRLATVFWYLSTVPRGGETAFPEAVGFRRSSDCSSGGLPVKPELGKVIIFYSLLMTGETDHKSLHAACPVKEGIKWAANKWVWNEPMEYVS